jgi:hypothetical protein
MTMMRAKSLMMGLLAGAFAVALVGCGPLTYSIKGSPKAPDLDAQIEAAVNKDAAMTQLKIQAEHLAPPDRLGSGKHFVVWAKDEKGKWTRVGALKYDDGDRKGKLEGASVPAVSFDLQVTVEKDSSPEGPSSDVIFAQHVN